MELSDAARRRGRELALPPEKVAQAHELIESGASLSQVARYFGVARTTVYRSFERENHGVYTGIKADVAAMKIELEQLRQFKAGVLALATQQAGAPQ